MNQEIQNEQIDTYFAYRNKKPRKLKEIEKSTENMTLNAIKSRYMDTKVGSILPK